MAGGGEMTCEIMKTTKCSRQINRIGLKTYLVPPSIHSPIFWNYIPNFP